MTDPAKRFAAEDYVEMTVHFKCNLKCEHCMIEGTMDWLRPESMDDFERILAQNAQQGLWKGLILTGSEVTLRRDLPELARAARGCYRASSLKELPRELREKAFELSDGLHCLRPEARRGVEFACRDIRGEPPARSFDLILCRNLVLTYFEPGLQEEVMHRIIDRVRSGGALVVGLHENLPAGLEARLAPWPGLRGIWRSA